jgi:hypothetical protein
MSSFTDQEQVNYVGHNNFPSKNNPYSNTYNAGWCNHPNFLWNNNQNVQNPQGQQTNFQQGNTYQAPPQVMHLKPKQKKNDLEGAILQFITVQQQTNAQTNLSIQKLEATTSQAIQRLETHVGQMAKEMSERKMSEFPSQTIHNLRGHKQVNAVTFLRNGKVIDNKVETEKEVQAPPTKATTSTKVIEREYVTLPLFPQRLVKLKKEKQLLDVFETLKKVEINIHLLVKCSFSYEISP